MSSLSRRVHAAHRRRRSGILAEPPKWGQATCTYQPTALSPLLDDLVVFGVRPDPDPEQVIAVLNGQGTVVETYANGPKLADFLEVERRMPWIGDEQLVISVGELLNLHRQPPIARPKAWCRAVLHRSVQRPA